MVYTFENSHESYYMHFVFTDIPCSSNLAVNNDVFCCVHVLKE